MRRSTGKIIYIVFFMAVLVSISFSQQKNKVGVVNSMEVLEKSIEGKNIISRLEEKNKSNQDRLTKMDTDLQDKDNKLRTQRLTLTEEALMNLTSDIERLQTDRKRFAEDSFREFTELRDRLFNKLQDELLPIIEQIGKDMDLEIIFDLSKSGAIYFSPGIDITAEVIKRYDAQKSAKK